MLLHAAIVALFGTSQGGGAGREAMLDALDVTLSRLSAIPDAVVRASPAADAGSGRALSRRADHAAAPTSAAERATTGDTTEIAQPPLESPPIPPQTEAGSPTEPQLTEPLPRIDSRAQEQVDRPLAPPPPALPRPMDHLAPPSRAPALAAPFEIAPRVSPAVPDAPIERLAVPAARREMAPPVELTPRVAPVVPDVPIERLAAPATERALAPPVELTPRVAPIVPATIDRLVTPRVARELTPSASVIAPDAVTTSAPVVPSVAAPGIERATVPATPSERGPAPAAAGEQRLLFGAPADDDVFKPRRDVVVPSAEPGGASRIDMNAARNRAREIASESDGRRGLLPVLPSPPERKSKESLALEKAIKPDCRTAYASMGLLAVPALVVSTIGDGGCRW